MRIATNTIATAIVRQLQQLNSSQARLQSQVATGQRITQPEDDPVAVGRVLTLAAQQRQITQYSANADRALQVSQASFAGLTGFKQVSDRTSEIASLSNGAQGASGLGAYAAELNQLIEQGLQTANSRLGNEYLFGGTAVDSAPFTATRDASGNITGVTYAGNTAQASIPLSETAAVTPGTTGDTNAALADLLNNIISLRDALAAGNTTPVNALQTAMGAGEDKLIAGLSDQGGVQLRIEVNQADQTSRSQNITSLISSETDADLPTTIVHLNQVQTAYQAALQSSAYIMKLSLLDYIN
ncbi:MAG TPA: flagellin [Opitutus sp.]|nr:flagellin [Opitutus sp.]